MATLEETLLEGKDAVLCYLASDEFNTREDDVILTDAELLKQYSELWRTSEPALRMLVRVMKTGAVRHLVEKAKPVETVGIRHELQAVDAILTRLAKYASEYERLEKGRSGQGSSEGTQEVPTEPPEVKEGQEGSL